MAKIIIKSECEVYNGMPVTFKAPCACNAVDGLKVECAESVSVFTFRDAHGNDLTGIGNLFDKGAVVKVVLDTESSGAFVQNADTNAYLEGRFDGMVQSVNGQRGDVILTPDRLGAASSSVTDVTVTTKSPWGSGSIDYRTQTLTSKLYTAGHIFVLDIPAYNAGSSGSYKDTVDCSALPDGYRMLDVILTDPASNGALLSAGLWCEINNSTQKIAIDGFTHNRTISMRVYGVVDGDSAGGTGGIEPDWVQAVIDTASGAKDTAEEAKAGTEQFAATLDALETGLSDVKRDITALEQAQLDNGATISYVADEIPSIKDDIRRINKDLENGGSADMSALAATQGVERVDAGGKVYIRGKAATKTEIGMVKVIDSNGVKMANPDGRYAGEIIINKASYDEVSKKTNGYKPIVPSNLERAVMVSTHQQMGKSYYPDDVGFEFGAQQPVSYAAVMTYINSLPNVSGAIITGATLEREE